MIYKNFIGSVKYSPEDKVFFGKIEFTDDLVSYEGNTLKKLNVAFHEAVDDYIELCEFNDREPG